MKRGLSPVIAVVLLVLITIVAATIIVAFVIPFVNKNLDEGSECFEVLGDLSFDETPYNCFNDNGEFERTGFSVRIDNENIIGFRVSLVTQGSYDGVDIINGNEGNSLNPNIRMLLVTFGVLEVPGRGGVRTYVAKGLFYKAEIFPILKGGGKCGLSDDILFSQCDASVADDVTEF